MSRHVDCTAARLAITLTAAGKSVLLRSFMSPRSPLRPPAGRVALTLFIASIAGSMAAIALVVVVSAGWLPPLEGPTHDGGWTSRSRAWFTSRGLYPTEFSDDGLRYAWTGPIVRVQIPNIKRSQAHSLTLRIEAMRAAGDVRPTLTWSVDGARDGSLDMTGDSAVVSIPLPARPTTRAVVSVQISPTFNPGPHDNRELGVIVRTIGLEPERGEFSPTWSIVARLGIGVALAVAGVLSCGMPRTIGVAAAAAIATAFTWLLLQDGAFLGTFADTLVGIGVASVAIGGVVAGLHRWRPSLGGVSEWAFAVGLVLAPTLVKLAFLSHPLVTIGDGVFQVHRATMVQHGNYFFTSITPRPFFEFPYAVGLFVAAKPFWSSFSVNTDHVWLLRSLSLAADALVGLAFYAVAWRFWQNRTAALLIAALWPFARAPFEALCNANLPNVFAQGLFGVAMAGLVWSVGTPRLPVAAIVATIAALAASYLSHFSTFSVGVPLVAVVALTFAMGGGGSGRKQAALTLAIVVAAATISYGVYYRHFNHVYRATVDRVLSHEVVDEPGSAIAATPSIKFRRWITGTSDDYGLPGAALALAGGVGVAFARRRRDAFTLALFGWLLVWIGFTVLGILTPVQMRVNLAAAPVFVCLGAYGMSELGRRGGSRAVLSVGAVIAVIISGAGLWFMCLGY